MSSGHHMMGMRPNQFYDTPAGPESKAVIHDLLDDLQGMHRVEIMWCDRVWALAHICIPQTDSVFWEVGFDLRDEQLHVRVTEFTPSSSANGGKTRNAFLVLLADPECQRKVRHWLGAKMMVALEEYYRTPGEWSSEAWDLRRFLKENFK